MVLVTGPAMSLDASGSLAGTLVFSKWMGRNYARQLVKPKNPKTAMQTAIRAMMRALSQDWKNLSAEAQANWADMAKANSYSPFNAYISFNMLRWRMYAGPTINPEYTSGSGTQPSAVSLVADGGPASVQLEITVAALNTGWGLVLHRSFEGTAPPLMANVIAIIPIADDGVFTYVDSPLPKGDYYYYLSTFTTDGKDIHATELSATAEVT
jgi:hypothetical protein